jgi:hypothetical protein
MALARLCCQCQEARLGTVGRHDRRPHEILVLADGSTPAEWWRWTCSAMEHDELAQHPVLS